MNILLINIDTLRADHLHCYGYPKPTSPAIDHLASEGALFKRCFAPGIPTTPAHTTLYTGLHPIQHNIVSHGGSAELDHKCLVLPQLLQEAGLTTCAVDNLYDIKPWLARGYEFYINPSFHHRMRLLISCEEVNRRAIPWIKQHANETFFLFVHYWEPHTPYLPPMRYRNFYNGGDPFNPSNHGLEPMKRQPFWKMWEDTWFRKLGPVTDPEFIASLYDGEIRHVDDGIAELMEALDQAGIAEETLVILLSDHGEMMYRHDIFFDHHGLYEDNVHVPLMMRWPGHIKPGLRVTVGAQHLDILPTLLNRISEEARERVNRRLTYPLDGIDLWPYLSDGGAAEWRDVVLCENTWQSKWGLRTESQKLILSREPDHHGMPMRELYDLKADPGEEHNLVEEQPERAAMLEARLEGWIASELKRGGKTADPLVTQPITLGQRWLTFQPAAAN